MCIVTTTCSLADQTVESVSPAKLSSRLALEIRSSLPKYAPPPDGSQKPEASTTDPDVLVLTKVVVKDRPPPKINSNDLITTKAFDKKLARDFQNSLKGLDAVLNGFSIPLISPSMAARGRAAYKAQRMDDLNSFIGATQAVDSKGAAKMNKAVIDMNDAEDWQNRVTGGK